MNKGALLLLFIFIFSINIISIKAEENENPNSILKQEEKKGFGTKVWEKIKEIFNKIIEFIKTKTGLIIVISVASTILLVVLTIIIYKLIKRSREKDDIPYINFYDSSKNPNLKLYDKSLNNISIPSDSNSKDSEPFQAHFKQNTFMNTPVQGSESYSPVVPPNYNSSSSNTNLFNKYGSNPRINNLDSVRDVTAFTPSPSSYDDINKGRPEPQNIFDGGFYPNRSSSLLGEDDFKGLNVIMNEKDENSITITNEEKSNIKPNNNENTIDFENIPDEFKDLKTYRVIHKFKPHRDDELMVEKNHLLKVLKTFEDGWAFCYSINNKDKGFIPMNKLRLEDEKPSESENEQNGALTRTNADNTLNTLGSNTASTKEIISNIMNIKKMDDFEVKQGSDINEITNKLSPSSEQDKLTFKYDEGEESEEHRIIIEDNTLSHDNSCHVVFDYTDTTANSFINYPSLGIQYDSQQQYSQSSQDFGIDTYLNVRKSFVPTKSKLHSMEIGNDTTTDDSIDNINYYINNSIINNSSSFSQQSVQNLSLSRQLFTATPSGLNPKRHKRSSSQPALISEDEFDVVPKQNKNSSLGRLRSKSNGRLETEYDNRRRNMYPAGNIDAKFTNDVRYGPTPNRFDNFLRSQKATENSGKTNEEEKRNSYFATDPRRISVNNKEEEFVSNQNFNSESRKRSVIIENDNVYYVNDMMPAKALRAREDTNLPRYRDERPPVNPVVYRNIMKSLGNANGLRGNIRPSPMAVSVDNYRVPGNMRSPYGDEINPNIPQATIMEQRAYIQQAPIMEQRTYVQQSPLIDQRQFIQQRPFVEQRPIEQRPYAIRSDIEDSRTPRSGEPRTPRSGEPRTPRSSEPRTPRNGEPRTPRSSEPRTPRTPKSPYTSYNSSYYPESIKSKSSNTSLKRDNPKSPYIVNPGYRNDNTLSYEQY